MLREITLEGLQGYFAALAGDEPSPESVDKVGTYCRQCWERLWTMAGSARILREKIRLKKRKLTKPKPFIRVDQFYTLLELIAEPYATMVYVAAFTALRVSELAG